MPKMKDKQKKEKKKAPKKPAAPWYGVPSLVKDMKKRQKAFEKAAKGK